VVARSGFNVLNSRCYSINLNRCKFELSKDPRQFYNFVNAKRNSSALPSPVRLNSKMQTDVINTNSSKAFDSVNHSLILLKLDKLGFPCNLLTWI